MCWKDDDEPPVSAAGHRHASSVGMFGSLGTLGGLAATVVVWMLISGASPGGNGMRWGTYYLFWLVGPVLIAAVASSPWVLAIVPVGLVARRWLPDPIRLASRISAIRATRARCAVNPLDVDARRQLAMLLLDLRRPRAALPLVEEGLAREPTSPELIYLRGLCYLGTSRWQEAVDAFVDVVHREPRFRYGDPYLRAADALSELRRWEDAIDALDAFQAINRSSLEAWCKLAVAKRRHGDLAGAADAKRNARRLYGELPRFQRRKQLLWYLRSFL